jgi:autotransporter-associated beta strand protein
MRRKNKNLAAVTMAAAMACGAVARGGITIGDWQSTGLITDESVSNVVGNTAPNDGWFDWTLSDGGSEPSNDAGAGATSDPGDFFPGGSSSSFTTYNYSTTTGVTLGTQSLKVSPIHGYTQNLSLKTEFETDSEGNSEMADFFNNTEFTIQVAYNAEEWSPNAGSISGLAINAQTYGFQNQPTVNANNGIGGPNYDTGNSGSPGNWDAKDYASPGTGGITTRTMTFSYANLLPGGSGNPNAETPSDPTGTIPANAGYVELIMATILYDNSETLVPGSLYFSNAQFTNSQVTTSWQAGQHAQGTPYNWGTNDNFTPYSQATLTGGMPCNPGDIVTFGNDIPTGITEEVDLNENLDFQISVGTMIFDNTNSSYLIAQGSGGTLTLNGNLISPTGTTTMGNATIADQGGNHIISAPIALATNTNASVTSGSLFTISGNITGTNGLTVGATTYTNGAGTLELSGANSYTGGTTVNGGKLLIEPTSPTTSALAHGALSITGSGAVQLADNVVAGTPLGTSNVNLTSLSITGNGTLDIGNNRIIVDYSSPATDPIASIATWIKNGFYDLAGPQIISSDIAADDLASGLSYGIGYADGADGAVAGLPSGEIEIMFTLLGDANLDGQVNAEDFTPFSQHLGQSGSWDGGDFNYDGIVNAEDFTPFSANLGQSASLAAAAGALVGADGLSLANVPEPTSMGLLTVGLASLLARRRKPR